MSENEEGANFNDEKLDELLPEKTLQIIFDEESSGVDIMGKTFYKLMEMAGTIKEENPNYLKFCIKTTTEKLQSKESYNIDEIYLNLLEWAKYLYILPPGTEDLDENEKIDIEARILKTSMLQILKMAEINKVLLFNYMDIVTTINSYEAIMTTKRKRKEISEQYLLLLNFLLTYSIGFEGSKNNVDISKVSIIRMLKLAGFELLDILNFLKININIYSTEEIKMRKRKLALLKKKSCVLLRKQEINDGETGRILIMSNKNDVANKGKRVKFDYMNNKTEELDKLLNSIYDIIKKKKEEIHKDSDKEINQYITINDINGKQIYIRKQFIEILKKMPKTPSKTFNIVDHGNNNVKLNKETINNISKDDLSNEYIEIQEDGNDNSKILVKKNDLLSIYEKWKTLNIKKVIQSYIPNKAESEIQLKFIKVLNQQEINEDSLPPQEEDNEILNAKKTNLLKTIKENNTLIEYSPDTLIKRTNYTKIQNHPGNFDNYSIKNNTNDQLVVISKKKLLSKPEDEYDEYLIIKYFTTIIITKKTIIQEAIEKWNKISEKPKISNYLKNKEETKIDLNEIEVVKIEDEELPHQPEEAKLLNEKIEKSINNEDNELVAVEDESKEKKTILIKKSILEIIKSKINDIQKDIYEVPIYDENNKDTGRRTKISKKKVLGGVGPIYVETTITEKTVRKKRLITKKSLIEGLNSKEDDIILIDNNNTPIKTKKSLIEINALPKEELPPQVQDILITIIKEINYIYVIIKDENGQERLVRKEYIQLIKEHQPKTKFDRYEIPDYKGETIYVSRKALENQREYPEYIQIQKKNDAKKTNYYINRKDLESLESHTEMIDEPYSYHLHDNKEINLTVNEIEIVKNTKIDSLPHQPEEMLMEDLIRKKNKSKQNNDNTDYIIVPNTSNQQIYVLVKYINDINNDISLFTSNPENSSKYFQRKEYKVKDYSNTIHKVSTNVLPTISMSRRFITINKNKDKKPILVDKNNLSDELQVAENPRYILKNVKDVNSNHPITIASKDFDFEDVPVESLPKQDELLSKNTIKIDNNIERTITNTNVMERVERPQANDEVIVISEKESTVVKEETKLLKANKPKPKKPNYQNVHQTNDIPLTINEVTSNKYENVKQTSEKRFYVIRRAVIRRIRTDE